MENVTTTANKETVLQGTASLQSTMSHRQLSEAEASAIWTILHLSTPASHSQELRIVLKPQGNVGASGWMISTE